MFESLESIDALGELSFVIGGTTVRKERLAPRAILTFPLALLAEVEFRRGKIAAAYAPAREFTQLAAETGQAFYLPSRL